MQVQKHGFASQFEVPSDGALFLRNLRFLNLDLREDWPNCSIETFAPKREAQLSQKDRIRIAEWVLFELFEIWNPKECKAKLRPFHPALEPVQSLKLRAAILQWMIHLKAIGLLGPECMLRKTLLDECKGAKFVEILLHFSTAVLKKFIRERSKKTVSQTVVRQIVVDKCVLASEDLYLNPLLCAHYKSLKRFLDEKSASRARIGETLEAISFAKNDMADKKSIVESELATHQSFLHDAGIEPQRLKNQLRDDCVNDLEWLSVMISGESTKHRDYFIETPFADVWSDTMFGKSVSKVDELEQGLLPDLQRRITMQRTRLAEWRAFQDQVSRRNEDFMSKSPLKSPRRTPLRSPQKSKYGSPRKPAVESSRSADITSTSPKRKKPVVSKSPKHELPKQRLFNPPRGVVREGCMVDGIDSQRSNTDTSLEPLEETRWSSAAHDSMQKESPSESRSALKDKIPSSEYDYSHTNGASSFTQTQGRGQHSCIIKSPHHSNTMLNEDIDKSLTIRLQNASLSSSLADVEPANTSASFQTLEERTVQTLQRFRNTAPDSSAQSDCIHEEAKSSQLSETSSSTTSSISAIPTITGPWTADTNSRSSTANTIQDKSTTLKNGAFSNNRNNEKVDFGAVYFNGTPTDSLFADDVASASVFKTRSKLRHSPPMSPLPQNDQLGAELN